ncbi:MFS transporter [Campylobacter sp. MIT 99-7217]|uniref:MFS transporter n=1 Tax=Campylobacter sp. MIT 99-7217 TaxID=535091 RepID=UPI00115C1561|nr:MFS transporter [Campylobacter sp. MIT 99-7217]TQR34404.1 MFS transporter [Campylobacter sp. MIT 99-7217]
MLKSVLPLSFIVGTRFFGLFIVLPVLSLYATHLQGANTLLIGFLVGVYALAQMFLQVPFGIMSDKFGRKKTLLLGLVIFIIGSFICAYADHIYMMILGRAIQGAGAVGAVAVAMISDFVEEENRGKAMAIMGIFIGLSFAASMVISPLMSEKFGLSSLFELSAFLSFICIILLYTLVPKAPCITHQNIKTPLHKFFTQKNFALMNFTNFMQKMLMSLVFVFFPVLLVESFDYPKQDLYVIYTFCMIAGFLAMGLAGSLGEKRGLSKAMLLFGVFCFLVSFVLFEFSFYLEALSCFIIAFIVFFIGFNIHEPIMQSCASKFAKVNEKGAALGVFNAFGYAGSFFGGIFGGIMMYFGYFIYMIIALIILWFILLCFLKNPNEFKNLYLGLDEKFDIQKLQDTLGIIDIYQNAKNKVIKFDSKILDEEKIRTLIKC